MSGQCVGVDVPGYGRVLFVLPQVRDSDPPILKDAIATRIEATVNQRCQCGATFAFPNRAERRAAVASGEPLRLAMVHENDCPACDANLRALVEMFR